MTLAECLEWDQAETSGRRWQLIDGFAVAMARAADRHGSIQAEIGGAARDRVWSCKMPQART